MTPLTKAKPDSSKEEDSLSLSWEQNRAAKKLLDVLVSILTEEYIQTAKENPEIFSK